MSAPTTTPDRLHRVQSGALAQFFSALAARGISTDDIRADGLLHRCDVTGKPRGNRAAVYILHLDGWPAGGLA